MKFGLTPTNTDAFYNVRTRPGQLPLIPLNIRIYIPEPPGSDSSSSADAALLNFNESRDFWRRRASIDLRLIKGTVEMVPDDDGSLANPDTARDPLDALHQPNQSWLSVVYVDRLGPEPTLDPAGVAEFAKREQGKLGYGAVMLSRESFVFAHEIGHCLGLSHTPWRTDSSTGSYEGMDYSTFCLQPFPNDLKNLRSEVEASNLMEGGMPGSGAALEDRWLSTSQVHRARLTIVSRRCPFSRVYQTTFGGVEPMLDDISGAFIAEAFTTDMPRIGAKDPSKKD
ncbi:MAG: M66 family metalloprotease [Pseudomonadota bacterium]|nr:M66 family metalloprotease [Pseudomonadota bacterium]